MSWIENIENVLDGLLHLTTDFTLIVVHKYLRCNGFPPPVIILQEVSRLTKERGVTLHRWELV